MKVDQYLIINERGVCRIRATKPALAPDEISCKLQIEVPDELFERPTIEARIIVKDVPGQKFNPEVILNTKDLIEKQTGVRVEMRVKREEADDLSFEEFDKVDLT